MSARLAVINGQIRQLIALRDAVGRSACDSGSGMCRMAADLQAARPALEEAIKVMKRRRRELSPVMDLEDAVAEDEDL